MGNQPEYRDGDRFHFCALKLDGSVPVSAKGFLAPKFTKALAEFELISEALRARPERRERFRVIRFLAPKFKYLRPRILEVCPSPIAGLSTKAIRKLLDERLKQQENDRAALPKSQPSRAGVSSPMTETTQPPRLDAPDG